MGAAGLRNTRITIQNKSVARSNAGDEVETWSTLATVWAKRTDVRGQEYYAANSLLEQGDVVFSVLYIAGVTVESRIVAGDEMFDVARVIRVGAKRRELEIYARSGVRDGRS